MAVASWTGQQGSLHCNQRAGERIYQGDKNWQHPQGTVKWHPAERVCSGDRGQGGVVGRIRESQKTSSVWEPGGGGAGVLPQLRLSSFDAMDWTAMIIILQLLL